MRDGHPVPLTPKAFETLLVLVRHSGHLVEKQELMNLLWPHSFVEESNLNRNISMLRKALGETHEAHQYIETVPKRGYRFIAQVREVQDESADLILEKYTKIRITAEEEEEGAIADCAPEKAAGADDQAAAIRQARIVAVVEPSAHIAVADPARLISKDEYPMSALKRHQRAVALTILVIAVAGVVFGMSGFVRQDTSSDQHRSRQSHMWPATPFSKTRITKLTDTDHAWGAAISPDGKYIVYVVNEAGQVSLWLRQVATDSSRQIVPPAEVSYGHLTFSPDGNYLYFAGTERDDPRYALYRMPALGGVPTKLITEDADLRDGLAVAPDGNRIAFLRNSRSRNESALMIANADGSHERKLATHKFTDRFESPAWSPDGKVIACSTGSADFGGQHMNVVAVSVADGSERIITAQPWMWVGYKAWLADSSGLIMVAADQQPRSEQIWHLSYPDGAARKVTNDTNNYKGISLTADSRTLVTNQIGRRRHIWIVPENEAATSRAVRHRVQIETSRARQIMAGYEHLSWTPDGKIVYSSFANGNMDLWTANADGTDQRQLTAGGGSNDDPTISPDGRFIVFTSNRTGAFHLWRMERDGSNATQLTDGGGEGAPCFTPDGEWVVYNAIEDQTLWKVPTHGGTPVQLTYKYSLTPFISPDGKLIAYHHRDRGSKPEWKIEIIRFEGGEPIKVIDRSRADFQTFDLRWSSDGQALMYEATQEGVSNLWSQPLDGGQPVRLTDFTSDYIYSFAWRPDGQQLACVRGAWTSDVVLISDFK